MRERPQFGVASGSEFLADELSVLRWMDGYSLKSRKVFVCGMEVLNGKARE